MSDIKEYCVGFAFSKDRRNVLLIQKTHPEYMAGKWNGIGGEYQYMEDPNKGMVREFQEETGVLTTEEQWEFLTEIPMSETVSVSLFVTTLEDDVMVTSTTEEQVKWFNLNDLRYLDLCYGVPGMVSAGVSMYIRDPETPTIAAHNTAFIFSKDLTHILLVKEPRPNQDARYVPICTLSYNELDGKTATCDYAAKKFALPDMMASLDLLSSHDISFGPCNNTYIAMVDEMFSVTEPVEWLHISSGKLTLELSERIMQVIGMIRTERTKLFEA